MELLFKYKEMIKNGCPGAQIYVAAVSVGSGFA